MTTCRSCKHSTGTDRGGLICPTTGRTFFDYASRSKQENAERDERLRNIANSCGEFELEIPDCWRRQDDPPTERSTICRMPRSEE